MAITFVTNGQGNSTDSNGFTTGSIDTTGANFIVVGVCTADGTGTLSDNKSNTWTGLTQYTDSFSDRFYQLFYAKNATVGSGHTFSITGTSNFPSLTISAFSGVDTATPFDVENGNANGFNNTVQTGSITPSANNELIVSGLQYDDSTTPSIDSSFNITDSIPNTSFGFEAQAMAYLIQGTAAAVNPTWSWTNSQRNTGVIASFIAGGGGGGDTFANTGQIIFI